MAMQKIIVFIPGMDIVHTFKVERFHGVVQVNDIKKMLESKQGVDLKKQVLLEEGKFLRNVLNEKDPYLVLDLYDKILEITLSVPVPKERESQHQVERTKTIHLKIEPDITALGIKRFVTSCEGILSENQRLKFDGKVIDDHSILTRRGVNQGSELQIEVGEWHPVELFVPQNHTVADMVQQVSKNVGLRVRGRKF